MKPTGMIVNGKVVPCDAPVYNWHDHGCEFKPGDGGRATSPKQVIDLAVWHWTAGEGDYQALYRVLDQRELGVEWFIGDGKIYQFCDPYRVDAFGAGKYNPRSVSTEVQNYGFRTDPREIPRARRGERPIFTCVQNGRQRKFASFYKEDLDLVVILARAISAAIPSIPLTTPAMPDLTPYQNFIPPQYMKDVKGHVGHYHLSSEKSDPGPEPLQRLITDKVVTPVVYTPPKR
jgi:hypothetical protein